MKKALSPPLNADKIWSFLKQTDKIDSRQVEWFSTYLLLLEVLKMRGYTYYQVGSSLKYLLMEKLKR